MKKLKIKFRSLDQFNDEVLDAMRALDKGNKASVKKNSDPKGTIFFDSQMSFQKFFTSQKIEILAIIKRQQPATIYELANIAKRGFPAVLKDVRALHDYGFVDLIENGDSRKSYQPKLAFNYEQIVIELPIMGYSVSLAA